MDSVIYSRRAALSFLLTVLFLSVSVSSAAPFTVPLSFSNVGDSVTQTIGCGAAGQSIRNVRVKPASDNVVVQGTSINMALPRGTAWDVTLTRIATPADIQTISAGGIVVPLTVNVEFEPVCDHHISVVSYGAIHDGVTDSTAAIQLAINNTPDNGVLYFPAGEYLLSDRLILNRRIQLKGDGIGTQIYQSNNSASLFDFSGLARGVSVSGFWLGSKSTATDTALIHLHRTHYARINDITMIGSYYGIWAEGSIGVEYRNLRTSADMGYPGFFQGHRLTLPEAEVWFFSSRAPKLLDPAGNVIEGEVASNASILINPILRHGRVGIFMKEAGFGNISIHGGVIESNSQVGLKIEGNGHPISVSGTHFENNVTDVLIDGGYGVALDSIHTTDPIIIKGRSIDVSVEDSNVNELKIAADSVRTRLTNTIVDKGTAANAFENFAPDTYMQYVGRHTNGASRARSTIGVGTSDVPDATVSPKGLIHVEGCIVQSGATNPDVETPCP